MLVSISQQTKSSQLDSTNYFHCKATREKNIRLAIITNSKNTARTCNHTKNAENSRVLWNKPPILCEKRKPCCNGYRLSTRSKRFSYKYRENVNFSIKIIIFIIIIMIYHFYMYVLYKNNMNKQIKEYKINKLIQKNEFLLIF